MESSISIKGTREGLTITLGTSDPERLQTALAGHLKTQGAFFRGGVVAIEVGDQEIDADLIGSLRELLDDHGMVLRTVVAADGTTRTAAESLGLRVVGPKQPEPEAVVHTPETRPVEEASAKEQVGAIARAGANSLVLRRRVRAGQVVRHTGCIVVIGDVNSGAEIIAGGDVLVWGRLRGTVHAGYPGNKSAIVCALDFGPTQLRIGRLIARPEDALGARSGEYPEVAYAQDNDVVVERWSGIQWRD